MLLNKIKRKLGIKIKKIELCVPVMMRMRMMSMRMTCVAEKSRGIADPLKIKGTVAGDSLTVKGTVSRNPSIVKGNVAGDPSKNKRDCSARSFEKSK
jgi:hypothetical protein